MRTELAERDLEVLAPVPEPPARGDRILKREFAIDLDARTVTCPAGRVPAIRTEPSGRRRARFVRAQCGGCRLRSRCVQPSRGDRRIPIAPEG